MPQRSFEDAQVRAAMTAYLTAAAALDAQAEVGGEARRLLDLAEDKAVAAMALRKRLEGLGWTSPEGQRSAT